MCGELKRLPPAPGAFYTSGWGWTIKPLGFCRHCPLYLIGKLGSQGPLHLPQHQRLLPVALGLGQRLAAWLSGGKISHSCLLLPVLSHRLFPEICALQDGRMVHSWKTLLFKGLCLCVCYACVFIYVCTRGVQTLILGIFPHYSTF